MYIYIYININVVCCVGRVEIQIEIQKGRCRSLTKGPMLETLDHTIRIGSTPTFLYFDLYIYINLFFEIDENLHKNLLNIILKKATSSRHMVETRPLKSSCVVILYSFSFNTKLLVMIYRPLNSKSPLECGQWSETP